MKDRLKNLLEIFRNPTYSRTLGVLVILVLIAIIPLTVYVAQKQQEIRQRASDETREVRQNNLACQNLCGREASYGGNYQQCYDKCVGKVSVPTPTPTPNISCSSNSSGWSIGSCGLSGNSQCQQWTQTCGTTYTCQEASVGSSMSWKCEKSSSGGDGGGDGNGNTESFCTFNGQRFNPGDKRFECTSPKSQGPCASDAGVGIPMICNNNETWSSGNDAGECSTDCKPDTANPTPTPTPSGRGGVPTPTPTQTLSIPACDQSQVNLAVSPNPAKVGDTVNFRVSGSQGSTWVQDFWSGGVDCNGVVSGSKSCTAQNIGTFTWTHKWQNTAPNNINLKGEVCSKNPASFTIIAANATPIPTPTPMPGSPTPTPTPTSSPSLAPEFTKVSLALALQGVGAGRGANRNPIAEELEKNINVQIFTQDGQKTEINQKAKYDRESQTYKGTAVFPPFTSGSFIVKVKANKYLRKRIPGIVTIQQGQENQLNTVTLVAGDVNNDNFLDIEDYNMYKACFGKSRAQTVGSLSCANADLNDDGAIDGRESFRDLSLLIDSFINKKGD